jgi:hypothetical protein
MPIDKDLALDKIGSPTPGRVFVFVGPCTVAAFQGEKIPADGRKYRVDGTVHFRNGESLPAKFNIDTTGFEFIVLDSVLVFRNELWFRWDEETLVAEFGAKSKEELLPFTRTPGRPLDFWMPAPYPMQLDPVLMNKAWENAPKWWLQKDNSSDVAPK